MRYILDTTLIIDHANADPDAVLALERLFAETGELFTCDVVMCEALSLGDPPHRARIGRLLDALEYVSTTPDAARWAADSRHGRHAAGGKLGLGDALIAAVAVSLDATVVTRNRVDFERQGVSVLSY